MELENIILSEVSQAQKTKNHVLPHMWTLDLGQMQQCCWTWITRKGESTYGGYRNRSKEGSSFTWLSELSMQKQKCKSDTPLLKNLTLKIRFLLLKIGAL
jgi:hypothetical protein